MIDTDVLQQSLSLILRWNVLAACFAGVIWGMFVGVTPGLTGIMAVVIALPLTFFMDPQTAIALLLGIYVTAIYGGAVTAIMIGALFIHGLNPGPMLMIDQPDMFWFITGALVVANCFMLLFGLTGIRLFSKIVEMPRGVLIPLILLLSIVGAYAVNNAVTDVYWMLGFGLFGYFMRHYGYPLGPVILGVILSKLLDDNWRRAIISEREDLGRFFEGVLSSPLSAVLFAAVVLILLGQTPIWRWGRDLLMRRDRRQGAGK